MQTSQTVLPLIMAVIALLMALVITRHPLKLFIIGSAAAAGTYCFLGFLLGSDDPRKNILVFQSLMSVLIALASGGVMAAILETMDPVEKDKTTGRILH